MSVFFRSVTNLRETAQVAAIPTHNGSVLPAAAWPNQR
jgi:hypothetical protein